MNNRAPALFPEAGGSDDGWLPANTGPGCLDGDNITPGLVDIIVGGEYPKCGIVVLRRPPMYVRSWPIVLKNSAPENRQRTRASALRNSTEILI
jgi:hypothetical protein